MTWIVVVGMGRARGVDDRPDRHEQRQDLRLLAGIWPTICTVDPSARRGRPPAAASRGSRSSSNVGVGVAVDVGLAPPRGP